jgi:hypothetical protein
VIIRLAGALVAVGAMLVAAPVSAAAHAEVRFRITDPRIVEASGIGVGIASPGVVYVQNDSGDTARFFALDAQTGATLAVFTVARARNVDWEDLAVARDARGVASVWLADIGDNDAARDEIDLYRVGEPIVDRSRRDVAAVTASPSVWRLRYPDGPIDAEGLAVAPGGAAYVVTKSILGVSLVYAVPAAPDASHVQTLRAAGRIEFRATGTPGGPNVLGQLTATGAALSPDGRTLVVRTYTDAYLWTVTGGNVAAALVRPPVRIALPAQPQGEGIAFSGATVLIDSEGVDSTVYAVPTPAPSTPASTASPATPSRTASPPPAPHHSSGPPVWAWPALGAVLVVGWGAVILRRRRR